jgi:general secretion pathway protein F
VGHFAYTGIDDRGRTKRGTIDADDLKEVRQLLRKQGVYLDAATPLAKGGERKAGPAETKAGDGEVSLPTFRKLGKSLKRLASSPAAAVSVSTRQLSTLLKAGIPLVDGLNALLDQLDNEDLQAAFTTVRDRVNEGISLATALADHPRLFPPLYVNMVAAGEASGTLDAVLVRLADFTENQVRLRNKVTSALAYPAFMAMMGVVILGVLMVVVIPKVTAIFDDFQRALPWYTSLLIAVSDFVGSFWWLIALVSGGAGYAFVRWTRTPEGAYKFDAFKLRMPVFGGLVQMVAVARFTRTLATLLASGVALLKAMDIVKNVLGNKVLEAVITEATTSIKEGESIADPLKRSGRFPPLVTHMIAIGERSGELESMLEAIANSYDSAVEGRLAVLTSLLEPVLIVVMGSGAGAIVFSILMPLMQLSDFAQ